MLDGEESVVSCLLVLAGQVSNSRPSDMCENLPSLSLPSGWRDLSPFDGSGNIEGWINHVDELASIHQWSDEQAATVAQKGLRGRAEKWYRTQGLCGYRLDVWKESDDACISLAKALSLRFKEDLQGNDPEREQAISDLYACTGELIGWKRYKDESIELYYQRTIQKVKERALARAKVCNPELSLGDWTSHEKDLEKYMDNDIYSFFGAGLRDKFMITALTEGSSPPTTHLEFFNAVKKWERNKAGSQKATDDISQKKGPSTPLETEASLENPGPRKEQEMEKVNHSGNEEGGK